MTSKTLEKYLLEIRPENMEDQKGLDTERGILNKKIWQVS